MVVRAWAAEPSRATATIASRWRLRWRRRWRTERSASTTSPTWRRRFRGSTRWRAELDSDWRSRLPPLLRGAVLQAERDGDGDGGGDGFAVADGRLEAPVARGDEGGTVEGAVAGTVGIVHVGRQAIGVDVDAQGHVALDAAAALFGGVARQGGAQEFRLARGGRRRNGGAVLATAGATCRGRPCGFLDRLAGGDFICRAFDDREVLADRRRAVAGGHVPPAESADEQQQDPQRSGGART